MTSREGDRATPVPSLSRGATRTRIDTPLSPGRRPTSTRRDHAGRTQPTQEESCATSSSYSPRASSPVLPAPTTATRSTPRPVTSPGTAASAATGTETRRQP